MEGQDNIAAALRANQQAHQFYRLSQIREQQRANERLKCVKCGHECRRRDLSKPEYEKQTLPATRHLEPGDCEPEEYVTICPGCGAEESFEPLAESPEPSIASGAGEPTVPEREQAR